MTENGCCDSIYYARPTHFLYTWRVEDFNKIDRTLIGADLLLPNEESCSFSFDRLVDRLRLSMKSSCCSLECDVTFFTCTGVALFRRKFLKFSEKKEKYIYNIHLELNKEDIKKLKALPKDTLFIVCDISDSEAMQKKFSIRHGGSENAYLNYIKNLAADFKNKPDNLSKEKVTLRVGEDTEVVNKAVLCSRSPVFARMFESDMREKKENSVTIDDVKIEAVRGLISYLYSGIVPDTDTNFLHDLYFIANKYDISELSDECRHLLVSKFTVENVCEILSLSSMCGDDHLKFSAMLFMGSNLRLVVTTEGWKELMINEPKTALKVADFFHLCPS